MAIRSPKDRACNDVLKDWSSDSPSNEHGSRAAAAAHALHPTTSALGRRQVQPFVRRPVGSTIAGRDRAPPPLDPPCLASLARRSHCARWARRPTRGSVTTGTEKPPGHADDRACDRRPSGRGPPPPTPPREGTVTRGSPDDGACDDVLKDWSSDSPSNHHWTGLPRSAEPAGMRSLTRMQFA